MKFTLKYFHLNLFFLTFNIEILNYFHSIKFSIVIDMLYLNNTGRKIIFLIVL